MLSAAHTMPLAAPLEDSEGVAPGKPNVAAVCDDGAPLNCPVVGLKAYCLSAPTGATYRLFCQNAGVAKMPLPVLTVCSTLFVVPLNLPRLSRFSRKRLPCFPLPITKWVTGPLG